MNSSARRALAILEVVNSSDQALGVTAIAQAVGTLPGTAFRSLDALERCGYIARYRASTQYRIGPAAQRLKQTSYAQFQLRGIAMPFLRRLSYASGETITLNFPLGWNGLRLATVAGRRPVRTAATTGIVGKLDADFTGRAILAGQSQAFIERFLVEGSAPGFKRDAAALRSELKTIAAQGLAIGSYEDAHPAPIALPVRHRETTIASIAIDGPVVDKTTGSLPTAFDQWQAIILELEALLNELDNAPVNPFAHIDPAEVDRLLCLKPARE